MYSHSPNSTASSRIPASSYEPLGGQLQPQNDSSSIHFKVDVPKAQEVAVVVEGSWTYLEKAGEENSLWKGDVNLVKHWGKGVKLVVCANYDKLRTTFSTLLDYSV